MKKLLYLYIGLVAIVLSACDSGNAPQPVSKVVADSILTQGEITCHGQYYTNVDRSVFSMDLYSDGISFSEEGYILGTGTNLYLSDIFLPAGDTVLSMGTYTLDTTAMAYTALPGMNYDGAVSGAYLLLIQDAAVSRIYLIREGRFVVSSDSIIFDLTTTDNLHYTGYYGHP